MSGEQRRRGHYLNHRVEHLSVYLREYVDGSIEFEACASEVRTDDDGDYEYTLTIEAVAVPLIGAAWAAVAGDRQPLSCGSFLLCASRVECLIL